MDLKLGMRQRPVPDVLVITAAAAADLSRTFYQPAEVRIVAEVVSEDSAVRDRERKLQLYAKGRGWMLLADRECRRQTGRVHLEL